VFAKRRNAGRGFAQAVVTVFNVPELLSEQWEYRELLVRMTARDLLLRYKQTVMGFGWAIFMPLVNTAIFSVLFTRVAVIDVGVAYPVYAFAGLVAWNFFASSLRFSVTSLTSNPSLVTKVYFPREIFPFSAVLVSLVDLGVALLVLGGVMVYYHVPIGWPILFLPVVILAMVMFTAAAALFISMANLFYRDVKYLFEVLIAVWMFATSVVYPVGRVGGRLGAALAFNPMTPLIEAFRDVVIGQQLPGTAFAVTFVGSAILLAVAWMSFHAAEFEFAENL
jgi:lipopolysaccharide transport system permease protein